MNWHAGLRRISAVFWGFWAVLLGVFFVNAMLGSNDKGPAFLYLLCSLGASYLFYRLTNWILAGFFGK
jgi:hypothetical protein